MNKIIPPHLWIPRRDRFVEVAPHGLCLPPTRIAGFYKMVAVKADGSGRSRVLLDWFPNIITDIGLNRMGTGSAISRIHVGTSNTAPAASDTALGGWVASAAASVNSTSTEATPPYFGTRVWYARFNPGVATGNLAEVGAGWASTNTSMFSRALMLDGGGSPTTITVLADEYLDVYYTTRLYPAFVNADGTPNDGSILGVSITNVGTRDVTVRCGFVTSVNYWTAVGSQVAFYSSSDPLLYTGSLGAVTAGPSGSNLGSSSGVINAYVNNSLTETITATWSLGSGNGTIKSTTLPMNIGYYQFEFDTTFTKNSLQTLVLNYSISWSRV